MGLRGRGIQIVVQGYGSEVPHDAAGAAVWYGSWVPYGTAGGGVWWGDVGGWAMYSQRQIATAA